MSVKPTVPDIPSVSLEPDQLRRFNEAVREVIQTREGRRGSPYEEGVTFRDLVDLGLAAPRAAGGWTGGQGVTGQPGPPGPPGDEYVPDYTPPPTPTGITAVSLFKGALIEWSAPTYTQGHGNAYTKVYVAQYGGSGALPTFAGATYAGQAGESTTMYVHDAPMGTQLHIWVAFVSVDDVEGSPGGGTNGVQVTIGKVGTSDLGPLIVEAGNLADGSVTAAKVAAGALDATKFAAGIEPVTIVSSVPGSFVTQTVFNTTDGKLYHWTGSAYVATIPSTDISGQLADSQIAALAASKVTGQLTNAQLAAIDAAKLTGQITTTQIADDAISTPKLAAGAVTANEIAANTITAAEIAAGAITASEIAAGAVTTSKMTAGTIDALVLTSGSITAGKLAALSVQAADIAADAITAGKIAAAAVNAREIAAGAISTDKLLVTGIGASMNPDPAFVDAAAWSVATGSVTFTTGLTDIPGGGSTAISSSTGVRAVVYSTVIPIDQAKNYRLRAFARNAGGASGTMYLTVQWLDGNKAPITISGSPPAGWSGNGSTESYWAVNVTPASGGWDVYAGSFGPSETARTVSGARYIKLGVYLNNVPTAGAVVRCTSYAITEKADYDLIVDGSIIASKLAAEAIAVGSAAIQDGAIVNAMIGTAAIDNAKISDVSAAKLTAGYLQVGSYLRSTVYTSGSAGWSILANGNAEFNDVTVRGGVYATFGSIGNLTVGGALTLNSSGHIKGGSTAYDTGDGFFLGYSTADYKFSIRNAASGHGMTWDGEFLRVRGASMLGSVTVTSTGHIKGGQSDYNTGTGFYLGNSGGTFKFSVGTSAEGITWDGSTFSVNGSVIVNGNLVADAVTSDKLSDGAIRAFAAATATAQVGYATWTAILTASPSINVGSTGKVAIVATIDFVHGYGTSGEQDYTQQSVPSFRIKRGTTVLATWTPGLGAGTLKTSRELTSYTYIDTPGGGSYAYSLEMQDTSGLSTTATAKNRSLTVMGIKR